MRSHTEEYAHKDEMKHNRNSKRNTDASSQVNLIKCNFGFSIWFWDLLFFFVIALYFIWKENIRGIHKAKHNFKANMCECFVLHTELVKYG